jgi:hypothetical protein
MKLLEEYVESEDQVILAELNDPWDNTYYWVINESNGNVSLLQKGRNVVKGFQGFIRQHPWLVGVAVGVGMNALDRYRSNKRVTTRFYARTIVEKTLYTQVVKDLVGTGKYTLMKNAKRVKDGWIWELKQKGTF